MSRAQNVPRWMAAPEEFRSTLKLVLNTAYKNDRRFDRSWTFRFPERDIPDLMVEIIHLEKRTTGEVREPPSPTQSPEQAVAKDFQDVIGDLLVKAYRRGIEFDRSWTFRYSDEDQPDLQVEIIRLADADAPTSDRDEE